MNKDQMFKKSAIEKIEANMLQTPHSRLMLAAVVGISVVMIMVVGTVIAQADLHQAYALKRPYPLGTKGHERVPFTVATSCNGDQTDCRYDR